MSQPRKLESLQVLRALAAVLVMLFHGTLMLQKDIPTNFAHGAFLHGECGVDLFFVLSGFIIYHTTAGKITSRPIFLWRRFIRIYPTYWLLSCVTTPIRMASPRFNVTLSSWLIGLLLIPQPEFGIDVAWTLAIEIAFYAVFALTFFIRPWLFFVALLAWSAAGIWNAHYGAINYVTGMWLNSLVTEFVYGVAIALALRAQFNPTWRAGDRVLLRASWVALAVGTWMLLREMSGNSLWFWLGEGGFREFRIGIAAGLVVYGLVFVDRQFPRWLVVIGDASYVLYLVHLSALSVFMKVGLALGFRSALATAEGAVVLFGLVTALACALHIWVERPMLEVLRKQGLKWGLS